MVMEDQKRVICTIFVTLKVLQGLKFSRHRVNVAQRLQDMVKISLLQYQLAVSVRELKGLKPSFSSLTTKSNSHCAGVALCGPSFT